MNKKLIVIIIVVAIIIVGIILFFFVGGTNTPTIDTGTTGILPIVSTSTPMAIPTSTTLIIGTSQGSVTTTNFYANAAYITQDQQTVAIQDSATYTIAYNVGDSSFVISLLSTPLEAARQAAEAAFLSSLGISQQAACKLNVYEGVPISVSDQYPGESFPLSFCGASETL